MVFDTKIRLPEKFVKIRIASENYEDQTSRGFRTSHSPQVNIKVMVKVMVKVKVNVKVMVLVFETLIRLPENLVKIRQAGASQ